MKQERSEKDNFDESMSFVGHKIVTQCKEAEKPLGFDISQVVFLSTLHQFFDEQSVDIHLVYDVADILALHLNQFEYVQSLDTEKKAFFDFMHYVSDMYYYEEKAQDGDAIASERVEKTTEELRKYYEENKHVIFPSS